MSRRRAVVVVIDALGVGALPDAELYGDAGTNTLVHLAEAVGGLVLPNLGRLGLGNITAVPGVAPVSDPVIHGRLAAIGPGKDSTAGHWGLMGVAAPERLPTYPDGFPVEVTAMIEAETGRGLLANRPANGLEVLEAHGAEHLRTGALIVYTSQDSVLQVAAHEDVLSAEALYAVCGRLRARLTDAHGVGRVIARPFRGAPGGFARTDGRRDFSLAPPARSHLETITAAGGEVHTVGKAGQLMGGVGVTAEHPGATNAVALASIAALLDELQTGLVFANLVETDQVYGHRHDAPGFAAALTEIDAHVGGWLARLGPGDLLVLTADHGVDVTAPHTDHTREYVPLLAVTGGTAGAGGRHDGMLADVGATVAAWLTGAADPELPGRSFLEAANGTARA